MEEVGRARKPRSSLSIEVAVNYIQKSWIPLLGTATWLVTSLAAFLVFPIHISSTSNIEGFVVGATVPLVGLVCGFTIVAPRIFQRAMDARFWFWASAVLSGLCAVTLSSYLYFQLSWTCSYVDEVRLVIGDTQLQDCERLLKEYAGLTENIFSPSLLRSRFLALAALYVVSWTLVAALVVSIANAFAVKRVVHSKHP